MVEVDTDLQKQYIEYNLNIEKSIFNTAIYLKEKGNEEKESLLNTILNVFSGKKTKEKKREKNDVKEWIETFQKDNYDNSEDQRKFFKFIGDIKIPENPKKKIFNTLIEKYFDIFKSIMAYLFFPEQNKLLSKISGYFILNEDDEKDLLNLIYDRKKFKKFKNFPVEFKKLFDISKYKVFDVYSWIHKIFRLINDSNDKIKTFFYLKKILTNDNLKELLGGGKIEELPTYFSWIQGFFNKADEDIFNNINNVNKKTKFNNEIYQKYILEYILDNNEIIEKVKEHKETEFNLNNIKSQFSFHEEDVEAFIKIIIEKNMLKDNGDTDEDVEKNFFHLIYNIIEEKFPIYLEDNLDKNIENENEKNEIIEKLAITVDNIAKNEKIYMKNKISIHKKIQEINKFVTTKMFNDRSDKINEMKIKLGISLFDVFHFSYIYSINNQDGINKEKIEALKHMEEKEKLIIIDNEDKIVEYIPENLKEKMILIKSIATIYKKFSRSYMNPYQFIKLKEIIKEIIEPTNPFDNMKILSNVGIESIELYFKKNKSYELLENIFDTLIIFDEDNIKDSETIKIKKKLKQYYNITLPDDDVGKTSFFLKYPIEKKEIIEEERKREEEFVSDKLLNYKQKFFFGDYDEFTDFNNSEKIKKITIELEHKIVKLPDEIVALLQKYNYNVKKMSFIKESINDKIKKLVNQYIKQKKKKKPFLKKKYFNKYI